MKFGESSEPSKVNKIAKKEDTGPALITTRFRVNVILAFHIRGINLMNQFSNNLIVLIYKGITTYLLNYQVLSKYLGLKRNKVRKEKS